MGMRSEYGPDVWCELSGGWVTSHRPAGAGGPWFCMDCGATDHQVYVRPSIEDVARRGQVASGEQS